MKLKSVLYVVVSSFIIWMILLSKIKDKKEENKHAA